jgi:cytochrome c oxidase subunit 2
VNIPSNITTLIAGILLTLVSLWYGQNHGLMPVEASDQAVQVDELFNMMMTIATGLFILVQGCLIVVAVKFRRRPGDTSDGSPNNGNIPLEIVWTAIPAVIVLIISLYSFEVYTEMGGLDPMAAMGHKTQNEITAQNSNMGSAVGSTMDTKGMVAMDDRRGAIALGLGAAPANENKPAAVTVNVLGLQYAWTFTYPETGIVSGELHLPVGQDSQLNIAAQDVLHAFWLPEFRIKQDAIPGQETELRFTPTRLGEYPVICAELCGAYHGVMVTKLYVETPEQYQAWLDSQQVAQADAPRSPQQVAVNVNNLSPEEYLQPYGEDLGLTRTVPEKSVLSPARDQHHHSHPM